MPVKVVLITGNELRHRYVAATCAKKFDLAYVYLEQKANIHEKFELSQDEAALMAKHFQLRTESEQKYFGSYSNTKSYKHRFIETGESNSPAVVDEIKKLSPDYIILFGSSLIKESLLSHFENRVINIHLGLSPYYRGSGTNFWPLVHNKPECVGATIHLATSQVDAGNILQQVRPQVSNGDSIHDMGNMTIIAAMEVLPAVIGLYQQHGIEPVKQNLETGFVCKRKDLTPEAIRLMYRNFDNGIIASYLRDREKRNNNYPIVDQLNVEK